MLKQDLTLQVFNQTDHCLKEERKKKKVFGLMKDELGGQIMKEFAGLKSKNIQLFKRQDLVCKTEEIKGSNITKQFKNV